MCRLTNWFHYASGAGSPANGDLRSDFTYDGLGRLRKRLEYSWNSGGASPGGGGPLITGSWGLNSETHYIYDGYRVIQERDGSNNPIVSYTRGSDLSGGLEGAGGIGGLLARSSGYSSSTGNWSTHYFYHADSNGNITYLADGTQALAASYRYDSFGNTMSSSGTLTNANVYRFSSKEVHANSGMCYCLYRFYDPNLQRWLNRDPIGETGGINLYGYVGNNPIRFLDPYALDWGDWWDPRTWFNSGFTESWYDSANSIGQALGGALSGDWNQVADAYDSGVLGQTKDADPVTKYGTRVAIGTATVCVAAAVAVDAAGISTRIAPHGSHHCFGPLGRLPHAQLNWWRAGVKGSGGAVRIPVPPGTPGFPP